MSNDKKHIFLVDDDLLVLQAGQNMLSEDYQITTVDSAEKMFELLESGKPDLILLDISMPNMNGYEAIEALKKNEAYKEIPVIFLTGNKDVSVKLKCYSLGAIDYITKPFDPNALLNRIKLCLM